MSFAEIGCQGKKWTRVAQFHPHPIITVHLPKIYLACLTKGRKVKVKVKVKVSLCLTKHHAMKMYWGVEV
jgi:hypothetical protein